MPTKKILQTATLFQGLEPKDITQLLRIAEERTYQKNDTLFHEGDPGDGFYVVLTGQVKIFKLALDGREQVLHLLGPGDPVGEVPVFAGQTFPANAQALASTKAVFFPRKKLLELYHNNPTLAMNMLAVLSRRLREFTVLIENLSLKEIPQRLATYLLIEYQKTPSSRIRLAITKGLLATMLGASQETLSRILGRLTQAEIITVQGKEVHICDEQALQEVATGQRRI